MFFTIVFFSYRRTQKCTEGPCNQHIVYKELEELKLCRTLGLQIMILKQILSADEIEHYTVFCFIKKDTILDLEISFLAIRLMKLAKINIFFRLYAIVTLRLFCSKFFRYHR
jgi:hypothetical protein